MPLTRPTAPPPVKGPGMSTDSLYKGATLNAPGSSLDMRRTNPSFATTTPQGQSTISNAWNSLAQTQLAPPSSYQWGGYQIAPANGAGSHLFDSSNPGTSQQTIGQIGAASQAMGQRPYTPSQWNDPVWYPVAAGTPGSATLQGNLGFMPVTPQTGQGSGGSNGGGSGGGSSGGLGITSSTISPTGIFSDAQTQTAINQAAGDAFANTDPRMLQQRFARPGRSIDAGMMAEAMPGIAAGETAAGNAMASIPLADYAANQGNLLQGQVAQGTQALNEANILRQLQGNSDYVTSNWQAALASLMGSLGRGMI